MNNIKTFLFTLIMLFMGSMAFAHGGGGESTGEFDGDDYTDDEATSESMEEIFDKVITLNQKAGVTTDISTPNGVSVPGLGYVVFAHKMNAMTPDEKSTITKVLGIDGNTPMANADWALEKIATEDEEFAMEIWQSE